MIHRFVYIALFLCSSLVYSQKLTTVLSEEEVLIGQSFRLTYTIVSIEPLQQIIYSPQQENLTAQHSIDDEVKTYEIEIIQTFTDTTYEEGEFYYWKGWYELVAWDSALVVLPPEQIMWNDSVLLFPPKLLSVDFPAVDPAIELYDIHETFTPFDADQSTIWWYVLALVVVLLIVLLFMKRRKKETLEIELPLLERTMQAIDQLEASKKYEESQKEYYYELSLILRRFLAELYQLRLLEKTSEEIRIILKARGVQAQTLESILRILNQSDLVKFAKHTPPISDVIVITAQTREIVKQLNQVINESKTDE